MTKLKIILTNILASGVITAVYISCYFIGFAAFFTAYQNLYQISLGVFFGTWASYCLMQAPFYKILIIISFFISAVSFAILDTASLLILGLSFFCVLFYGNTITKKYSLRKIPYLKSIIIASPWILVAVFLPYLNGKTSSANISLILFGEFIFILALALIFDIRDIESDRAAGLTTIATRFDEKNTKQVSAFLFLSSLIIFFLHTTVIIYLWPWYIFLVIGLLAIYNSDSSKGNIYFVLIIDALIAFKGFAIYYLTK